MRVTRIAIIAALFTAAATTAQAQNLRFLEPGNQPFDQSGDLLVVMGEDLGLAFDRAGEGGRDPNSYGKSLDIRPLNLTESELKDLVSFLGGLTAPLGVE